MSRAINDELLAIEHEKDVDVLFAVESGSRSWGFASHDSDYDVRFVYVRPLESYLSFAKSRDTIEHVEGELDIVGWDARKYLTLMRHSNPSVFEWLGSDTVYVEDGRFEGIRALAAKCFDPKSSASHYLGMTRSSFRLIVNGYVTLKRYLYAARAISACRWTVETGTPAPTRFEDLKYATLCAWIRPTVDDLVEMKVSGAEKDACDRIPDLDEWIIGEVNDLEHEIGLLKHREPPEWHDFDSVFLKLLEL